LSGNSNVTIRFCSVGLIVFTVACSTLPGPNDGGFKDAGVETCNATKKCSEGNVCVSGECKSQFFRFDLDEGGPELTYLSMAVQADAGRVGIAYFAQVDGFGGAPAADGGNTANYEIRYVEWNSGQSSPPQVLRTVQRVLGVSVAFQQNGEPAVAYLGGGADMSAFWYQSDAVVNYRSGGSTWTERSVATRSDQSPCGSPLDIGFLVGVFPSLVFDGPKAYLAWRDGHNGQFPQQDWAGSDLKVSEGGPTAWTTTCQMSSGNVKQAYGARTHMVMANGQPALVHDRAFGGADTPGKDILVTRRKADGTWTNAMTPVLAIQNTMSGGSVAWDAVEGYGIAAIEHSTDVLNYTRSSDGMTWDQATPVLGGLSGGWYPSLAMDPKNHEPAIAFYICSKRTGQAEGTCLENEDELRISQRVVTNWTETLVDLEGGYLPKIGFFDTGKRVVAYRVPKSKRIRLAVER
jgi:hypothetical protein